MTPAKKILIIRFSSIGDIVLTTPVIRCIKQQLPEAEVHYLTKQAFKTVLEANPYIDKLHYLQESIAATVRQLKIEKFDFVVDLHHNLRTLLIKNGLGVRSASFNKLNWQKWMLVRFKKNRLPPVHIVDRYIEAAAPLGITNDGGGLDFFFTETHDLQSLLPPGHHNYIALVIGAQHATKRLPTERLIELCTLIKQPVVLLGGPEDADRGNHIAASAGDHVWNACGKFSLQQSAFLVSKAEKVISHDTGLMHIAAAFNKPTLSVWGNTVPEFGMYPYKVSRSEIFEVEGLKCRPCSKIGYARCPLGHFKCMNNINLDKLAQSANE